MELCRQENWKERHSSRECCRQVNSGRSAAGSSAVSGAGGNTGPEAGESSRSVASGETAAGTAGAADAAGTGVGDSGQWLCLTNRWSSGILCHVLNDDVGRA